MGNDVSGNNNDFTVGNLSTHDQMLDSPTNNFCTFTPLTGGTTNIDFSEGNLKATTNDNIEGMMTTFGLPLGGKYYWEVTQTGWAGSNGDDLRIGVNTLTQPDFQNNRGGSDTAYSLASYSGKKDILGTETAYGTAVRTGNVIGVAVDRVNHTIQFYNNGSGDGTFSIASTGDLFPWIGVGGGFNNSITLMNFGQDSSFAGQSGLDGSSANASDDNGIGDFYDTPPSGFLAVCSSNLPTADAVDPAQTDDDYPQKLFTSLAYTGGTTGHVTGFKPDWVWVKARNTGQSNGLWDSTRGTTNVLLSNEQNAESTSSGLTAFNTDGYNMGTYYNQGANTYASWSWRANGGTTASNGTGDITSTVQADPSGCFSIVTYTGSGTAGDTIGHGLSTTPDMIMIKNRSSVDSWAVYSSVLGNTIHLVLDTTSAQVTSSAYWNSTSPTSSVFTVGTGDALNQNTKNYVAYCFANCEGYIKAGSYVGNGNVDNAFVYTGFRPAFVLTKGIRLGDGWNIHDNATSPFNVADTVLQPNTASAELSNYNIDMLSNGFKVRGVGGDLGSSGVTYIYLAFAKNPFKYATAR